MLKKIVRDILIVTGIIVMAVSTSDHCMNWLYERKSENEAWWGIHKDVEGDLVTMSYMQRVEKFSSRRDYAFTHPSYPGKKVDLYAWGDSYIWKIPDSAYAGIRNYKFGWRYRDDVNYKLDTSQVNVLLIELTERYIRSYFSGTDIFSHLKKDQNTAFLYLPARPRYATITLPGMEKLFNPHINSNIEYNLFNYNFINPIRQWKAAMNYHLFNRASGAVVISKDEKQLFFGETVIGNRPENSFYPVRKTELDSIVNNLNTIYNHYKEDGFDEVYFSFVPNPVTILQPEEYNNLIPSIESHRRLQAKFISVYSLYKQTNKRIYRPGDTHWNNEGLQIWLSEINKMLVRHNELAN
jgi:hypothetical protein